MVLCKFPLWRVLSSLKKEKCTLLSCLKAIVEIHMLCLTDLQSETECVVFLKTARLTVCISSHGCVRRHADKPRGARCRF